MRPLRLDMVGIAVGAVLLAGCGSVTAAQSPTRTHPSASSRPSLQTAIHGGPPPGVDPHKWAAKRNAAAVLGAYKPPPGSVRLAKAPKGSGLNGPPSWPATPDLVDRGRLWKSPGEMTSTIAWVSAHPPADSTQTGTGESGRNPPGVPPSTLPGGGPGIADVVSMDVTFSLPASGPAISSRQVLVTVTADGHGHVVLRVDVQEVWYPTRPSWSFVQKSDTSVTATVWTGAGGTDPHTVTTKNVAAVDRMRHLVNSLPMSTGGAFSCPAEFGQYFKIAFRGKASSVTLVGNITECGGLRLTEHGHGAVVLADSGGRVLAAVEALTGTTGLPFGPSSASTH